MIKLFLLRNQQGLFINRHGEWVSGAEAASLQKLKFKDEAINEVFEISARDVEQRVEIVEVDANDKGVPIIPPEWIVAIPETPVPETTATNDEDVAVTTEAGEPESAEHEDLFQASHG